MNYKKIVLLMSISIIIFSLILSILSIHQAISIGTERTNYLEQENIHFESYSIHLNDGIDIKGFLYLDKD